MKMSFICVRMKNDFHIKGTYPRFETEARGNSEMTYSFRMGGFARLRHDMY